MSMRLLVAMAVLPVAAFGVTVEPLPQSDYADTEVSTNIPFAVSFDAMSRLEFTLLLDASPTNCVEAAIGTDTDNDGNLSPEETNYTVGYRCGKWFQRDAITDTEAETTETHTGRIERMFTLRKRKLNPAWNLLKVTRRGKAEVCELATVEGAKPGAALIVR